MTEKEKNEYRKYDLDTIISDFYKKNHINQTYDFVLSKKKELLTLNSYKMSIHDAVTLLNDIIDDSDPDTKKPQIIHLIQTGEAMKKLYPDKDYMHLIGFIHDLGKMLCHPKLFNLPQWQVVGDTFPVGCKHQKNIVYYDYFKENPDIKNEKYSTDLGIYKAGCGFDAMDFSWGHDEYMYQVCKQNECLIPEDGLYIIRYHSFYAWHNNNTDKSYEVFASEYDKQMLINLQNFQKCDLYSKKDEDIKVEDYLPYYTKLIDKYFPKKILKW